MGLQTGAVPWEMSVENINNIESKTTSTTPWHTPMDSTSSFKDTCPATFIATLLTTVRRKKQVKCPSITKWKIKTWNIYTMEYY